MSKNEVITLEEKKLELEIKKFELERESREFEMKQRYAKALSVSAFFPDTLKNDIASAVIVRDLAKRMDISEMEVAQSIYIIYGRPSFATSFLVARLNQSGLIKGALKTVVSDDGQSAYCEAIEAETGEKLKGMTVTMEMARKEGWVSKKGSKWQTMPELMLRKRAQSFFIKEYYPQVMFGVPTAEEAEDVIDTTVIQGSKPSADLDAAITQAAAPKPKPEPEAVDAQIEEEPEQEAQSQEEKPKRTRTPRYISKHYPRLERLGIPTKKLRDFVWFYFEQDSSEQTVEEFFAQGDQAMLEAIKNWADLRGVEINLPEVEVEKTPEEEEPKPKATKSPKIIAPKPGMARYVGLLMRKGLKQEDFNAFLEWAGLNADNIKEFMEDEGAVAALIEQFNAEAGYVGEEIPV